MKHRGKKSIRYPFLFFLKKQLLFYWAMALLWSKYLAGNIYGAAVMDDWLEWRCVEPNKGASFALRKTPKHRSARLYTFSSTKQCIFEVYHTFFKV